MEDVVMVGGVSEVGVEVDVITSSHHRNVDVNKIMPNSSIVKSSGEKRTRSWSAIPDVRYEKLIQSLLKGTLLLSHEDPDYKNVHRLVHMGRLKLEKTWDPVWNKEWDRIVDKSTGRIVPRTSEISTILEFYFHANGKPGARSLVAFANQYYCGIGKHHADEFVFDIDKAERRHGLTFRKIPKAIATKPMQHVQIDVTDMCAGYDEVENCFTHMLSVHCLFSRYFYALPLCSRDAYTVTKQLIEFFNLFGPPEAYQTYTGNSTVDECMQDVAAYFHVAVHCYGRNGLNTQVMFGRQPWAGPQRPPWNLDPHNDDQEVASQNTDPEGVEASIFEDDDNDYWKRTPDPKIAEHTERQQKTQLAVRSLQTETNAAKTLDNYFQLQFVSGDDVYVRNPDYIGSGPKRYLRGMIVEVSSHQEWPYRVRLDDPNTDGTYREHWFSPIDVTATTKTLEVLRKEGIVNGKRKGLCQCEDRDCRKPSSEACPYKLHRGCCRKEGNVNCKLHHKGTLSTYMKQKEDRKSRIINTNPTAGVRAAGVDKPATSRSNDWTASEVIEARGETADTNTSSQASPAKPFKKRGRRRKFYDISASSSTNPNPDGTELTEKLKVEKGTNKSSTSAQPVRKSSRVIKEPIKFHDELLTKYKVKQKVIRNSTPKESERECPPILESFPPSQVTKHETEDSADLGMTSFVPPGIRSSYIMGSSTPQIMKSRLPDTVRVLIPVRADLDGEELGMECQEREMMEVEMCAEDLRLQEESGAISTVYLCPADQSNQEPEHHFTESTTLTVPSSISATVTGGRQQYTDKSPTTETVVDVD